MEEAEEIDVTELCAKVETLEAAQKTADETIAKILAAQGQLEIWLKQLATKLKNK